MRESCVRTEYLSIQLADLTLVIRKSHGSVSDGLGALGLAVYFGVKVGLAPRSGGYLKDLTLHGSRLLVAPKQYGLRTSCMLRQCGI